MEKTISHDRLCNYLMNLKNTLDKADFSRLNNVIFFNNHSFFCYLSRLNCGKSRTIGGILAEIEDCIPFSLTRDSFSMFLEAYDESETAKMEALRKGFVESCKMDFLLLLLHVDDSCQWEHLVDTCEHLRQKTYL